MPPTPTNLRYRRHYDPQSRLLLRDRWDPVPFDFRRGLMERVLGSRGAEVPHTELSLDPVLRDGRDLRGIELTADLQLAWEDVELENIDLSGARLEGLRLRGCTFRGVNFNQALIGRCSFERCTFVDCSMAGARLDECGLLHCTFERLRARSVHLAQCDLKGSGFTQARFPHAVFEHAGMLAVQMTSCDLSEATFDDVKATIADVSTWVCNLRGATVCGTERIRGSEAETYLRGRILEAEAEVTKAKAGEEMWCYLHPRASPVP